MRWFVAAVGLGTLLLIVAIVTGWGLRADESTTAQRSRLLRVLRRPRDRHAGCVRDRDPPLPAVRARHRREEDRALRGRGAGPHRALLRLRRPRRRGVHRGEPARDPRVDRDRPRCSGPSSGWRAGSPIGSSTGDARRPTRSSRSSRIGSAARTRPRTSCPGWRGSSPTPSALARPSSGSTSGTSSGPRGSSGPKAAQPATGRGARRVASRGSGGLRRRGPAIRASSSAPCRSRCRRTIR